MKCKVHLFNEECNNEATLELKTESLTLLAQTVYGPCCQRCHAIVCRMFPTWKTTVRPLEPKIEYFLQDRKNVHWSQEIVSQ